MTKESILRYAYLSFLFFMLWGWVFRVTILFNQMMLYLICLVPLLLFVFACSRVGKKVTLWRVGSFIPFIIYSILCYLVQFDTYKVAQWLICLFILLSAKEITDNSISNKFIIGSGLFCFVGILVQMLLPNLYYGFALFFFLNSDQIESWFSNEIGYAGFTYQLGVTAVILILSFFFIISNHKKCNLGKILLLVIIFVALFLTGKRSFAAMAVTIPLMISSFKKGNIIKLSFFLLFLGIIGYCLFSFFVQNIDIFIDVPVVNRFAKSYIGSQMGEDISTGRFDLYEIAYKAFSQSPIFGIGAGLFKEVTHAYTDVHNAYLQVLCEQGIIGLILFIFPLLNILIDSIQQLRIASIRVMPYIECSVYLQIFYILYSFTGNTLVDVGCFGFYSISLALYIKSKTIIRYENNSKR